MSPKLQFSLRQFLFVSGLIGVLLSIVGAQLVRQRLREARKAKIESLIDEYNVAVAARDDIVFLLNGNADSSMEGLLADGEFYAQFQGELTGQLDDDALGEILRKNKHIEILDLRGTLVTAKGLDSLVELTQLHSLAVDASQCNAMGVNELAELPGLRRLVVDGQIAVESHEKLKKRLSGCEIKIR
ncbi:MAG TPA: hypothetical protein DDW52_02930 [Planctomycetaceae bacterium]|nr:hypothetical protein [Planctomycetaceae bacterium]